MTVSVEISADNNGRLEMKSVIKSIALVSTLAASMAVFGQASASTITLPKAVTGTVTVKQSIQITCNFSGTLQLDSTGQLVIANPTFSAGNILCGGAVKPNAGPWVVSGVSLTGAHSGVPVTISNVGASTFLGGNCLGNITGTLSDSGTSGHTLTVPGPQTIPGTPSSCQIIGGTFNF